MDAKEYLSQIAKIDDWLSEKENELRILDNDRYKITSQLNKDGVFTKNNKAIWETLTDKIVDMEVEINEQMKKKQEIKCGIMTNISMVKDITLQTLLSYRYIQCLEWCDICEKLHYGERQVYYLHADALNEMTNILNSAAECS